MPAHISNKALLPTLDFIITNITDFVNFLCMLMFTGIFHTKLIDKKIHTKLLQKALEFERDLKEMQIRRMVCQKASIFCTSCIQTVSKQQNSKICTKKILQSSVFLSCTNKILIYNGVAERLFTWFDGNNIRDWIFDTANTKLCFTGHQQWPAKLWL